MNITITAYCDQHDFTRWSVINNIYRKCVRPVGTVPAAGNGAGKKQYLYQVRDLDKAMRKQILEKQL